MNYFFFQLFSLFRGSFWESYLNGILGVNCLIEILINLNLYFGIYILFILDIKEDNYCLIMLEQFVNMMKMQPIIQFKNQGHKSKNLKKIIHIIQKLNI